MPEESFFSLPWWAFDMVIGFVCVAGAMVCVEAYHRSRTRALHLWERVGLMLAVVSASVVFWGSFVEPHLLRVREVSLSIAQPNADRVARVAVLSDIHVGPYKQSAWVRHVVERVNRLQPDFVLIPGDFVFGRSDEARMLAALADIQAPVYATIGNHDHQFADPESVARQLEAFDVHVLRDRTESIVLESGAVVNIVGLDDWWLDPNLTQAFSAAQPNQPTILVTHNPDVILHEDSHKADLIVTGHTHCGQIRLPWVGPVPPLPTELGRAWDCGWFRVNQDTQLWITPGVGETGPRARLFNPPTIDLISLTL